MKKKTMAMLVGCVVLLGIVLTSGVGVWSWAQSMRSGIVVHVVPWNNGEDQPPLSAEETEVFLQMLHTLRIQDFTKNKKLTGGTPTCGVRIETVAGVYYLNEAFAPDGKLEIQHGGAQWWVRSPELAAFILEKAKEGK